MPKEHGLARGIARVLRRLYVRAFVHVWRVSVGACVRVQGVPTGGGLGLPGTLNWTVALQKEGLTSAVTCSTARGPRKRVRCAQASEVSARRAWIGVRSTSGYCHAA